MESLLKFEGGPLDGEVKITALPPPEEIRVPIPGQYTFGIEDSLPSASEPLYVHVYVYKESKTDFVNELHIFKYEGYNS
jgi:hypothetical protein